MGGTGVIDSFLGVFTSYIDSGSESHPGGSELAKPRGREGGAEAD